MSYHLIFANWTVLALEETFLSMCWSSRAIILRFSSKTQWQMFLLLYGRPSEGHKHGVSIQSSINLGHTLLQITCGWKTAETWILARLFIYQSSIVSQTLDFFYWMTTIFILITWLVKSENFLSEDRRTVDVTKFYGKRFATESIFWFFGRKVARVSGKRFSIELMT